MTEQVSVVAAMLKKVWMETKRIWMLEFVGDDDDERPTDFQTDVSMGRKNKDW